MELGNDYLQRKKNKPSYDELPVENIIPLTENIIPLIVSTHGNYIVDRESQLQTIDFNALLPPGSSDDYTIWTWTFMPILGNPATHIKETMDLMYLSRDFFLQLFSLNLEDEYFTRYIQEAQNIVSKNYISKLKVFDVLVIDVYKHLDVSVILLFANISFISIKTFKNVEP